MSLSIQRPEPGGNGLREAFTRPMTTLFRRSTAPISPPDGSKCPATLMSTGCDTAERLVRVNPAMVRGAAACGKGLGAGWEKTRRQVARPPRERQGAKLSNSARAKAWKRAGRERGVTKAHATGERKRTRRNRRNKGAAGMRA